MALFTAGAVLGGLGLGAKLHGQNQASNAIDNKVSNALQQQRMTQDRLDQERQQSIGEAMDEMSVGRGEVEGAQRERERQMLEKFRANTAGGGEGNRSGGDPSPASPDGDNPAGRAFSSNAEKLADRREADSTQRRESTAEMDSLADVFNENNLDLQPAQTELRQNQRTAREEAQRLPLEVQVATRKGAEKGKTARRVGDLGMTAGTALMSGGSSGPWADMFGSAATANAGRTAGSSFSNHPTARR